MYTCFVGEVFIVSEGYICIHTRVGINNGDIVWRARGWDKTQRWKRCLVDILQTTFSK